MVYQACDRKGASKTNYLETLYNGAIVAQFHAPPPVSNSINSPLAIQPNFLVHHPIVHPLAHLASPPGPSFPCPPSRQIRTEPSSRLPP